MAFPTYVGVMRTGYGEAHGDIALRTEMDRGVAKQRKTQSDVMVQVSMTLTFDTKAILADFEDWYYGEAQAGMAWFDWTDPRTGTVRQARVVANSLGASPAGVGDFSYTSRTVKIEYLRAL